MSILNITISTPTFNFSNIYFTNTTDIPLFVASYGSTSATSPSAAPNSYSDLDSSFSFCTLSALISGGSAQQALCSSSSILNTVYFISYINNNQDPAPLASILVTQDGSILTNVINTALSVNVPSSPSQSNPIALSGTLGNQVTLNNTTSDSIWYLIVPTEDSTDAPTQSDGVISINNQMSAIGLSGSKTVTLPPVGIIYFYYSQGSPIKIGTKPFYGIDIASATQYTAAPYSTAYTVTVTPGGSSGTFSLSIQGGAANKNILYLIMMIINVLILIVGAWILFKLLKGGKGK